MHTISLWRRRRFDLAITIAQLSWLVTRLIDISPPSWLSKDVACKATYSPKCLSEIVEGWCSFSQGCGHLSALCTTAVMKKHLIFLRVMFQESLGQEKARNAGIMSYQAHLLTNGVVFLLARCGSRQYAKSNRDGGDRASEKIETSRTAG